MSLARTIKLIIKEVYDGSINWAKPNADNEYNEVDYQLSSHKKNPFLPDWVHKRLGELSNKSEWDNSITRGVPTNLSRQEIVDTNNTGDSWENSNFDPEKKARAPSLYGDNKEVERPIILKNPLTNERHLISGHHRSTYVSDVLNQPVSAHIIESIYTDWLDHDQQFQNAADRSELQSKVIQHFQNPDVMHNVINGNRNDLHAAFILHQHMDNHPEAQQHFLSALKSHPK
jgi:hypothetical protein